MDTKNELLNWKLTPWIMNGKGGWKQQPVILIEGEMPYYFDHPTEYITKLLAMAKDTRLESGQFHTFAGELRDELDQFWGKK